MKGIPFTSIPLASRPETNAWQVLIEQSSRGQTQLFQDGDQYLAKFPDEVNPIPFEHLAYDHNLGLYDKRNFPEV